jgi:outer membrane protein assembly factor BamB
MKDKRILLETGEIARTPPLVVNDTIIVQSAMAEGLRYEYSVNAKGLVRAFDAKTGKQLWRFNTIPIPAARQRRRTARGSGGNVGV